VFTLDKKHIDESTLLVYVNGVLQTLTTHYTVSLNNTTPTITFVTAPTNTYPVTATYEYYMPVRFDGDPALGDHSPGVDELITTIDVIEDYSGAHKVEGLTV